jgi:hypothetical protein
MKIVAFILAGLLSIAVLFALFVWILAMALGGTIRDAASKIRGKD